MPEEFLIKTLIIVPCHAIWLGGPGKGLVEKEWLIKPFQTGETPLFIEHMRRGVAELAAKDDSILVFSGGPTYRNETSLSEAESYLNVTTSHSFFSQHHPPSHHILSLQTRTFIDPWATDSYQNILFPLLQFPSYIKQLSQRSNLPANPNQPRWPSLVIVVNHQFKKDRFVDLHAPALKLPAGRFAFRGVGLRFDGDGEEVARKKAEEIRAGDRVMGYGVWKGDLYGAGSVLRRKRIERGWDEERNGMFEDRVLGHLNNEERRVVQDLLEWDGGATGVQLFPSKLPWEETGGTSSNR